MKSLIQSLLSLLVIVSMTLLLIGAKNIKDIYFAIYKKNGMLEPGYEIGVDSENGRKNWLVQNPYSMRMDYPGYPETWGVVYFTIGESYPDFLMDRREAKSFTMFDSLLLDMRSNDRAVIHIGMKDKYDRDNGWETKLPIKVDSIWRTYSFALDQFHGLDLENVYVPVEFVFEDDTPATVLFRNVRFHLKE